MPITSVKQVFLLIAICMIMPNLSTVHADSLQSLLMPGEVISAHKKYEQQCDQCHDTSDKDRQGLLCVQCHAHETILNDLSKSTGFHGRITKKLQNNCKHCHTEHNGRNANIILFDPNTFNHDKTDFQLHGSHLKTNCNNCHLEDKKYAEAPSTCYSCHKKADVHKGKQGKKCDNCHNASNWKETEFDHDNTDFPLKGSHKKTQCAACHINQKYKDTPKQCINCHQIQDIHNGGFGKKCDTCHTTKKWPQIYFNHNKQTDFPLQGKHKTARCNSCHKDNLKAPVKVNDNKLATTCFGCHKNDDTHKGQYGQKCQQCHTPASWERQNFDHGKKTNFPLRGKHAKVNCNQCHKSDLFKKKEHSTETACVSCHKKDDVHNGNQGKVCSSCHNEKGWHDSVSFDHDLSSFPLIGMHAATQCEECHITDNFTSAQSACNHCHADDDVHKTVLGTRCNECHNPNAWDVWRFDHDRKTDFKLEGAHENLGCFDCHQTKTDEWVNASSDCIACHRSDDIHNRSFGRHCNDCHSTTNFKDINIKRYR